MSKVFLKGQKSPGLCSNCCHPEFLEMEEEPSFGHKPKNCQNPPFCSAHYIFGHAETLKCRQLCVYCRKRGHTMQFCRKLKNCDLCGKRGHNPHRCWEFCTLASWARRAKELNRCMECLTLCTTETNHIGENGHPNSFCPNCYTWRTYWNPEHQYDFNCKESQTEENSYTVQESQTELQEGKATIENQKMQIEELNNKILVLENKLESSNATIDNFDWKLQSITKEKEQELQNVNKLDSLCKEKEMELRKLQEQISQKDLELAQHRQTSAQSSQSIPAPAQQPCPTPTFNHLEHINETSGIKATLKDIQDQQQKISVVVNYLCNKIMTQDMHWHNQSSFNPYLGPYDTGQYFNKVQQVY